MYNKVFLYNTDNFYLVKAVTYRVYSKELLILHVKSQKWKMTPFLRTKHLSLLIKKTRKKNKFRRILKMNNRIRKPQFRHGWLRFFLSYFFLTSTKMYNFKSNFSYNTLPTKFTIRRTHKRSHRKRRSFDVDRYLSLDSVEQYRIDITVVVSKILKVYVSGYKHLSLLHKLEFMFLDH